MPLERSGFPKEIELPFDEGIFARSALIACLTDDECRLAGVPDTAAGRSVVDLLTRMGYAIENIDETQINITGNGYTKPNAPDDVLDCASNGDLAHIFAGFLAGFGLYGAIRCADPGQSLAGLASASKFMGGEILGRTDGIAPPWTVRASSLALTEIRPANPHPSLRSALGFIFLLGQGTGALPQNTPGTDAFERALQHYKGEIRRSDGRIHIKGGGRVVAKRRDMPRSFRVALRMMIASALKSSNPVRFNGVCINPGRAVALEILGRAGIDFVVENMSQLDGEIIADLEVKPSSSSGIELDGNSVRSAWEDIHPLLALACISHGLSDFNLSKLASPEADGVKRATEELCNATGAEHDSSGDNVTIEGNPDHSSDAESISSVSDFSTRIILAILNNESDPVGKERCIDEMGGTVTKAILGDILF